MKNAIVFGGSNGIGLAVSLELAKISEKVVILDIVAPPKELSSNFEYIKVDLAHFDISVLNKYTDVDIMFFSAGIGRIAEYETFNETEIEKTFQINSVSLAKILNFYFPRICSSKPFYCGVMVSIAGRIVSPLFSLYGATKSATRSLIESLNIEIEKSGSKNQILEVSPGSLSGTRFNGDASTDLQSLEALAHEIINGMMSQSTLLIPKYDETFKGVIARYRENPHQFGLESYEYKLKGGRINPNSKIKVGYLSGTFDLFHIGHLNLLRRAKEICDYLVVGVHRDASHKGKETFIPFEERREIVASIKYVDKVIESEKEDCDVYLKGIVKYDYLFVGSDYKGTERFNRYEELFASNNVEIVYFSYTQGTSSTQLRKAIEK